MNNHRDSVPPSIAWALRHMPYRRFDDMEQLQTRANGALAMMLSYPPRDLEEFMLPHHIMRLNETLIATTRRLWSDWIEPDSAQRARAKYLRFARRFHEDIQRLTRERDETGQPDHSATVPGQSEPPSSWLDASFPQWHVETLATVLRSVAGSPDTISGYAERALPRRPSGYGPAETPPRNRKD